MKLEDAVEAVQGRSQAALEGSRATCSGGAAEVSRDTAEMLLAGVAVDPQEALDTLTKAAGTVVWCIANGDDPMSTISGALLETFVLGALVGESD